MASLLVLRPVEGLKVGTGIREPSANLEELLPEISGSSIFGEPSGRLLEHIGEV